MRALFALAIVGLLVCCGGEATPLAPSPPPPPQPPPPAVSFFRIDATSIATGTPAALSVGQSHTLIARGFLVGGGLVDLVPTWQVDNRNVLTIDAQGRITGISNGWATVVATYSGMTSSLAVRVVPDYGGTWSGTWKLVRCDASDPAYCASRFPPGVSRALDVSMFMNRTFVTAIVRWDLDGLRVSAGPSVEINEDGSIVCGGRFFDARGFEVPLVLASWRFRLAGTNNMTGVITLLHGSRDPARTEWEMVGVVRSPS